MCPGAVFPLSGSSGPSVLLLSCRLGQRSPKVQGSNSSRTYWCLHLCLSDQHQHNILVLIYLTVSLSLSYSYHETATVLRPTSNSHHITSKVSLQLSNHVTVSLSLSHHLTSTTSQSHPHCLTVSTSHNLTPAVSLPPCNSHQITSKVSVLLSNRVTVSPSHSHCLTSHPY